MSPAIFSRGCLRSGIPVAGIATCCLHALGRGYVQTKNYYFLFLMTFLLSGVTISSAVADSNRNAPLTLEKALSFAIENDAWLSGSRYVQQATEAMSESAYQLPDPKFSVALANLPTDTLDFDQEAMTQLVFGVSQKYPRGDTRRLKRQQLQQQSERQPFMRQERKAKLKLTITQLWLDAYLARQSVSLIEQDLALFDQLVDISLASYSTVMGRTRQQDLIKAQLEKTRIEDRLTKLRLMQEMKEQKLLEWLTPSLTDYSVQDNNFSVYAPELPQLNSKYAAASKGDSFSKSELANHLVRHPSVRKLDKSIDAAGTSVKLAKQKYKPEWGVSASYGYRGDDLSGRDRADLFSAGVTVSMPLFSSVKQDKEVEAAIASQEKLKTDRSLMLKKMLAGFHSARTQLERLDQRQQLYQNKLLPQAGQQAQAALNAYESDTGSFTEVVRTRIAELNARIDYLEIKVKQQKQIAQLNYFLTSSEFEQSFASGTGVAQ
ncbi:TolC family protein [Pontibacterium granulatum]|uniref:TolC family protein n=1 Tax=Pontibacterium granulatum TaxID=2036029 RepID=UPI00249C3F8A|nr:TolC family protein [Pontibacterium granulatum]MDI3326195.1 TolC family protein [Pontibacterium granulatum]